MNNELAQEHYNDLKRSELSDDTIREASIKSIPSDQISKRLGFNIDGVVSAYEIPFSDDYSRYRLFYEANNGVNKPKYLVRKDSGNKLYIPSKVLPVLNDVTVPLMITEGEKKALKAGQEGMYCIGVTGLWNWKKKDENELIQDFDKIALNWRTVYIIPDNDYLEPDRHGERKNLKQAVYKLAYALIDRGARVYVRELPTGSEKIGLDDYLCTHTVEELKQLPKPEIRKQTINEMLENITSETPPDEIQEIVKRIAGVTKEVEKSLYVNLLHEKTGIAKKAIESDIQRQTKEKPPTQAEILLKQTEELTLFHDDNKDGYTFLDNEILSLRSKRFKQYLSRLMYQATGKAVNSETLANVIGVLGGKAVFDNPERTLFNRVACADGVFLYDLGAGQAVNITTTGWTITEAPIMFRRYSHQQTQVTPVRGGDPWQIFEFLNIHSEHKLLVLVYIISCFIPEIPHPIFHPHGAQGTGKTTLGRVIKKIVDPSSIETLITPRDLSQLIQTIAHHHVCIFDNLSDLPQWMSDILSQACTGGGFSKRQLYTDDEDIIYKVKRCIGLNGINLTISKPDLMDRSILLQLDRIDTSKRIDEKELWEKFEAARPEILGGMLDTIFKAMKIHPDVKLSNLPRMADFAKWGYAIAEVLGSRGNEFFESYQQNVEQQNEEVIQGNTLAQAVLTFMHDQKEWEGMIKDAWEKLNDIAEPNKKDGTFPRSERTLRKYLERIKTNLMDLGVTFQIGARAKKGVPIVFRTNAKLATFDTPRRKFLSNEDLEGVNKDVEKDSGVFNTLFDTPSKSIYSNGLHQGVDNVPNFSSVRKTQTLNLLKGKA